MSKLRTYGVGASLCAAALLTTWTVRAQAPIEQLPAILQLQLSQQPAWRAYRDATAETQADAAHDAGLAVQLNALSTPQRLNVLRDQLLVQRQGFERQAAATQALYATLSPEQRHIFDDVTRLPTSHPPSVASLRQPSNPYAQVLRVPPSQAGLPPLAPSVRP